jgi:hypothetical protein
MHLNRLKLAIKYRQKKVTLIQYIFLMLPHVYICHRRSTYIYSLIYYFPIAKSMNILCPFALHNTLNRFMRIFQTYLISRRFRIMQAVKFSGRFRKITTRTFMYNLRIFNFVPGGFDFNHPHFCIYTYIYIKINHISRDIKIPMYLCFLKCVSFCCLGQNIQSGISRDFLRGSRLF